MAEEQRSYPKEFLEHLQSITNKRAKIVIDHILEHGYVTTEELRKLYNYEHPPRARMDVKDCGIPVQSFRVKSADGKSIAAYKFGDLTTIETGRLAGRIQFSKAFKHSLYVACQGRCQICDGQFEERYLQVDHRVPYEVNGDTADRNPSDFMLLCGSCNRAKSWSCEHCENWRELKRPPICMECYWGSPERYNHIATEQVRRLDLQWNGDEIQYYDATKLIANQHGIELPKFIKQILADKTKQKD